MDIKIIVSLAHHTVLVNSFSNADSFFYLLETLRSSFILCFSSTVSFSVHLFIVDILLFY